MSTAPKTDLTHDDVSRLLEIIDTAEHLDELELDFAGLRLHVRRGAPGEAHVRPSPAPARSARASADAPAPAPAAAQARAPSAPEGAVAIRAPMLGTFYRAPSPGEPPFVEVGQRVAAGDTVCLIEVMKLFNSISAGVDGTVVAIHAENAGLVEYNQPLIYIMPAGRT